MIKSATFPYKTALSKANVKTNRMGNTKWTKSQKTEFCPTYLFLKTPFEHKKNVLQIVD